MESEHPTVEPPILLTEKLKMPHYHALPRISLKLIVFNESKTDLWIFVIEEFVFDIIFTIPVIFEKTETAGVSSRADDQKNELKWASNQNNLPTVFLQYLCENM